MNSSVFPYVGDVRIDAMEVDFRGDERECTMFAPHLAGHLRLRVDVFDGRFSLGRPFGVFDVFWKFFVFLTVVGFDVR